VETIDWLWILHPTRAVVLIYPLIGVVVRLGVQTKARRVDGAKLPPTTGREHTDLGRWLSAGVVAISLVALTVVIATDAPVNQFQGGTARACQLLLVLVGTVIALITLWRATEKATRLAFALITWLGVISLGAQPEVFRLSDNPFQAEFWQSHYWAGVGVVGLMLFSLGARPEILRELRWRRLHVSANVLAAVLFVIQGMTGTRDLLEIPLHWQKSALEACNWTTHVCPPSAPTEHPGRPGS
jgi:cell division protein FtsW (lipid II flippase)